MKKILIIWVLSCTLLSCSKKNTLNPTPTPIIGTWYADSVNSKEYTGANLTSNTTQTYNRTSYKYVYSFGVDTGYYVTNASGFYNYEQFTYSNNNNTILYIKYQNAGSDTAQVRYLSGNKFQLELEVGAFRPYLSYKTFYFSR